MYIQTTENLDSHFQDSTNYKNIESLLFPVDIKETAEYSQLLHTYKFEKGLTDIRPVPHKEKKSLLSFMQKRNTRETSQLIKFTFICNEKIEKRHLRLLETQLNNIFTTYGRNDLKANVQTVFEGKLLVSAA